MGLMLPRRAFVGRDRELADIEGLLAASRLVTLTGDPGIGKGRLAVEAANRGLPGHPDGAYLVEHAGEQRPVRRAVASALGLGEHGSQEAGDSLEDRLGDQRVLLVLAGCEGVREACGGLAATLLDACPQLTILATSQEPLGVPGERVWRVPPLVVPPPGDDRRETLEASDAVALFCQRVGWETADLDLIPDGGSRVAGVCRRLHGNPLAIELAAAWVGELTLAQIAAGLERRMDLLGDVGRARYEERARPRALEAGALEAVISWSFDLLTDPQKTVLRRLSVVASGAVTLERAGALCAVEGLAVDDVPALLEALAERALIGPAVAGGHTRYRVAGAIREFVTQRREEAGGPDRSRAGFAACLALVEEAEAGLAGPSQGEWLERLESERDAIRAAIEQALAQGRGEAALRLAAGMVGFWRLRGFLGEGISLLERCRAAAPDAVLRVRAKAAWGSGMLVGLLGDLAAARSRGEESLRLARRARDPAAAARALDLLGFVAMHGGGAAEALKLLDRSVAMARRAGEAGCLAGALERCGQAHLLQGDARGALPLLHECFDVARAAGDRHAQAMALVAQGWAAVDLGEYEVAEARIRLAQDHARSLGDRLVIAESAFFLAQLARLRGDLDEARDLLGESRTLAVALGAPLLEVRALAGLAAVEMARRRYEPAEELFGRSVAIAREVGLPHVLAQSLLGLSGCATAMGRPEEAREALGEALDTARRHGDRQTTSTALYALATLARDRGDPEEAGQLHAEALGLHFETGDPEAIARSLEGIAGATLDQGHFAFAARLFGAGEACWKRLGRYGARWPWEVERHQRDLARLAEALGAQELGEPWQEGAARPLGDIVSYALRDRGDRRDAAVGPAALTKAELEVARLAARGLTSREAAERLFISPRTVESHLASIYRKLGISSRKELRELEVSLPELARTSDRPSGPA